MAGDVPILSWQMFFIAVPALACALFAFFYAYVFLPTASGSLKLSRCVGPPRGCGMEMG